ncbi:Membrane-bound protease, CAAX family [Streptococcus sp. DD11]|uniref:CPBP family intramembrane glutamic endopeptidase n=1 Tax=Streptococcus sp. DD11 TaxID=1777879 RepID=UPI00079237B8|nr:CPBP family intramembrane glutamic endopeptidase [Streptococcus sp. DD11]KXT85742.1 Membrane-bound protease, CAAX family [Streptococcus sp. DD11]
MVPILILLSILYAFCLWKWYKLDDWSLEVEESRLKVWAWLPALLLAAFILIQTFISFETSNNQSQLEEMIRTAPIFTFVYSVVVAPVLEEFLFRGFLAKYFFPKQKKAWQTLLYLAVSSILFSRLHGPTTTAQFLVYFYMGITLGLAYVTKKDLRYPILLHMINNLSVFLLP